MYRIFINGGKAYETANETDARSHFSALRRQTSHLIELANYNHVIDTSPDITRSFIVKGTPSIYQPYHISIARNGTHTIAPMPFRSTGSNPHDLQFPTFTDAVKRGLKVYPSDRLTAWEKVMIAIETLGAANQDITVYAVDQKLQELYPSPYGRVIDLEYITLYLVDNSYMPDTPLVDQANQKTSYIVTDKNNPDALPFLSSHWSVPAVSSEDAIHQVVVTFPELLQETARHDLIAYPDNQPVLASPTRLVDAVTPKQPIATTVIGKSIHYVPSYPSYVCIRCIGLAPLPPDVAIHDLTIATASQVQATCCRCYESLHLTQADIDYLNTRYQAMYPYACSTCGKRLAFPDKVTYNQHEYCWDCVPDYDKHQQW